MNPPDYFAALGLPRRFELESRTLEDAYHTAIRACHPDRHAQAAQAERLAALTRASLVNDAYEQLKDPLTRAAHLLALRGQDVLGEQARVAPALLHEIMELREQLESLSGVPLGALVQEIRTRAQATQAELQDAFTREDDAASLAATQRLHYLKKAIEEGLQRQYAQRNIR